MSKKIKPTVLRVCGKTSDLCSIAVQGPNGEAIAEHVGYVPDFFPGEHYGDYLMLDIDIATGKILNWGKPDPKEIDAWVAGLQNEEEASDES